MIAISYKDYLKYGCPKCGCDVSNTMNFRTGDTLPVICEECKTEFIILADGLKQSRLTFGDEAPKLQEHPRKGIPWHPYEWPDPRPENGEYARPRVIGYDLACFLKSKKAGERLLDMVKEVTGKDNPSSWLDYRENEPKWIQFKFQKEEFDLPQLSILIRNNDNIVTKDILSKTVIKYVFTASINTKLQTAQIVLPSKYADIFNGDSTIVRLGVSIHGMYFNLIHLRQLDIIYSEAVKDGFACLSAEVAMSLDFKKDTETICIK